MTTVLALSAFVFTALSALLLWRASRGGGTPPRGAVTDVARLRERLAVEWRELEQVRASGAMDEATGVEEERRLAGQLRQVFVAEAAVRDETAMDVPPAARSHGLTVALATVAVAGIATGLYLWQQSASLKTLAALDGSGAAWTGAVPGPTSGAATGAAQRGMPPMVMQMVGRLEARLKANPNDPEGWARLARAYDVLDRDEAAGEAWRKAHEQAPDHEDILTSYAAFVYSAAPTETTGPVRALFDRLYALNPSNLDALWFLGLAEMQAGDSGKALGYWKRLDKTLPADAPERAHLQKIMAKLGKRGS